MGVLSIEELCAGFGDTLLSVVDGGDVALVREVCELGFGDVLSGGPAAENIAGLVRFHRVSRSLSICISISWQRSRSAGNVSPWSDAQSRTSPSRRASDIFRASLLG